MAKRKKSVLETMPLTKWEEEVLDRAINHRKRNPHMSISDAVELALHQRRICDWMEKHPRKKGKHDGDNSAG